VFEFVFPTSRIKKKKGTMATALVI